MIRSGPRQLGLTAGWDTAGRPIRATIIALGLLAGVAVGVQVIVLASPGRWGWTTNPAWVVAGLASSPTTFRRKDLTTAFRPDPSYRSCMLN